ncbi:hypothetical protein TSUD_159380 [Trifolium subterraneum]|uniref:K Homology domain-containing protein n=1 Tax=Trifolium subterraneum TaxID=3900 RepID=A0A2Z6M8H3_TRISU|nr:hypothetical protein TSUD_159380 [Trifolium subterraneum]
MTAKFDWTSASEPHKMSGATSTASSSNQKLSKFGAKSGFVIPKNKLLGSLVPILRGAKKDGVTGVINEESPKQIERKSRWGPDPTQDASVKRAKVLALQETGTKIKIHATKADTEEKGEIKPGTDVQCSYKEMHIKISADSFDKVDAAISIIELLISSVTGNSAADSTPVSVSGDNTNVPNQNQDAPPSHTISLSQENQAVFQPAVNTQMRGDHFQYSGSWFSAVQSHTPLFASSGSVVPPNPPHLARNPHFLPQRMRPSSMISAFGAQPAPVAGFHPIIPNQQFSMQAPPPAQRPSADYYQVVPRPNNQATSQGGSQEPPSGPWPPPFGFSVPDQPLQSFQRTQVSNQVDPTQAYGSAAPFGGRPGSVSIPPRHPAFPYAGQPSPRSQVPQMGMRNFIPSPQMPNLPSPGAQRGMHNRQSYPAQGTWPDIPMPLNQKFGNNPSLASNRPAYSADQIYDPFSPTSVAPPHQKGNPEK